MDKYKDSFVEDRNRVFGLALRTFSIFVRNKRFNINIMKKYGIFYLGLLLIICLGSCSVKGSKEAVEEQKVSSGNPFLPGNFADPSIIYHEGTYYIYATTGVDATVWYSDNFVDWKVKTLNWPTSTKINNMWAPDVAKGKDGKFYIYYSLNSQIYAGVADDPKGPFRNLLDNEEPFIKDKEFFPPKMHTIDAHCYLDDDGETYLYWGSGWGFKDGVCAVGILNDDMCSFKEAPKDITPSGYFEGPYMFKRNGKYYLMYSDGIFMDDSYKVRYAISDSPMGPFEEGKNSPILVTDEKSKTHGPGHHSTIEIDGEMYIVYHKHEWPLYHGNRQVCIDKMTFDEEGYINKVIPTESGVSLDFIKGKTFRKTIQPEKIIASVDAGADYTGEKAFDNNMGSLWMTPEPKEASIIADFGKEIVITSSEPVFAEVRAPYNFKIEYSTGDKADTNDWQLYYQGNNGDAEEWPIEIKKEVKARLMKLTIEDGADMRYGLWEWKFFGDKK